MTTPNSVGEQDREAVAQDYVMSKFASAQDMREAMLAEIATLRATLSTRVEGEASVLHNGINALRWLLNITTEFDRKDVRTRQAARLLDEFGDYQGKTNRQVLEDLWELLTTQEREGAA